MNINQLNTPIYLIQEEQIRQNLSILKHVIDEADCKILLAQKAFSMFSMYPIVGEYLSGATSSGLYEAKLAFEEFKKESHVFSPAYTTEEMRELCGLCSHIVFNSLNQLEKHRDIWEQEDVSVGLRVNPGYSTQEHDIYDPCAKGSRLGIRKENFGEKLPKGVKGLHFHTLCEQGFEPLLETYREVEKQFSHFFNDIEWINLGGGHHITKEGYDVKGLISLVKEIKDKWDLDVYLEPGEAVALNAGSLITTVMDIVDADMPVLILDASAACHMPDVLEMPYRPPIKDGFLPKEKKFTCRLSSRTCLAGDIIGEYSFDKMPQIGDRLEFLDMAIYSMVKNNTFNGMPLPDIGIEREDGTCEIVRQFSYEDFKGRLS